MKDYNSHTQESEQAQKAFNTKFQVRVEVYVCVCAGLRGRPARSMRSK